jgi:glucokinase
MTETRTTSGTDARVLLAGDVGGTKTNLAAFTAGPGGSVVLEERGFHNADYASLAEVVQAFTRPAGHVPRAACFGVAGPVADGRARMPNLDWEIEARDLARVLDLERVLLLNDLEATGYGIPTLAPDQFAVLNEGARRPGGDAALIAAGTGLGEAILRSEGERYRVAPSEGGHGDYAPVDAEQTMLLGRLRERFGHVSYERVISGPGIHNVYDALDLPERADLAQAIRAAADPSALIAESALASASSRCMRALDVFVASYGAEAGNLALRALATGGIFVAGGIAPKVLPKLRDGTFMRAFTAKGRFADWLRSIPVNVVLDPTTALRGAAAHLAEAERRAAAEAATAKGGPG